MGPDADLLGASVSVVDDDFADLAEAYRIGHQLMASALEEYQVVVVDGWT